MLILKPKLPTIVFFYKFFDKIAFISLRPTSLKPIASILACTVSVIVSRGFLSYSVTSLGRLEAIKVVSEPALSGFLKVFGGTMILVFLIL